MFDDIRPIRGRAASEQREHERQLDRKATMRAAKLPLDSEICVVLVVSVVRGFTLNQKPALPRSHCLSALPGMA